MKVSKPGFSMASDLFLTSKGTYLQKLQKPRNTPVSKHIISSLIAAMYDPSGLVSPTAVV